MRVRRLGWAGLEVEASGERLVIDYVRDVSPLFTEWMPGQHLTVPSGEVSGALVTHLHRDHTDAAAIAGVVAPGAPVLRPAPGGDENDNLLTHAVEGELAAHRLNTEVLREWASRDLGPFRITAVPAEDGFGDPQLNWVVEADGQRIFHGGDTMFHGHWWQITRRFTIDAAFLPINGPVVDEPLRQPSSRLAAALDPRHAAEAARILDAGYAVPIHYEPEEPVKVAHYVEVADPETEFRALAPRAHVLTVGEWLDLSG